MIETFPITKADEELIASAVEFTQKNFKAGNHFVGVAIRNKSGKIYNSVNLSGSPRNVDICAEPVAVGQALTEEGGGEIDTIVAVRARSKEEGDWYVVSPCGPCRELILKYAAHCHVIIRDQGDPYKVVAESLLPGRYRNEG